MNYLAVFFTLLSLMLNAQQGTYADVEQGRIRISQLDSSYINVLDPDPAQSLFKGKGAQYYDASEKMLTELGVFLKTNNFTWGAPVKTIIRVYYKGSGRIDHFICDLKKAGVIAGQAARFDALLRDFIKNYVLNIEAAQNYYHRRPFTFKD